VESSPLISIVGLSTDLTSLAKRAVRRFTILRLVASLKTLSDGYEPPHE
jgi:hypothetical protein